MILPRQKIDSVQAYESGVHKVVISVCGRQGSAALIVARHAGIPRKRMHGQPIIFSNKEAVTREMEYSIPLSSGDELRLCGTKVADIQGCIRVITPSGIRVNHVEA